MKKIYLMCPYSHPNKAVREYRFQWACQAAAYLMSEGAIVFSPISHSHPIAQHIPDIVTDYKFWMKQDLPFIEFCDVCMILTLDGWSKSKGIRQERRRANRLLKPILKLTQKEVWEWERKRKGF